MGVAPSVSEDGLSEGKANRSNNTEFGNHAFNAVLGDQIYSKNEQARSDAKSLHLRCHNLTRIVSLEAERALEVDLMGGARLPAAMRRDAPEAPNCRPLQRSPSYGGAVMPVEVPV